MVSGKRFADYLARADLGLEKLKGITAKLAEV